MIRMIVLMSLLTGCASGATINDVVNRTVKITVIENPLIEQEGLAFIGGDTCTIILKRYPKCLKHEIRHCLEGQWHGENESSQDCY